MEKGASKLVFETRNGLATLKTPQIDPLNVKFGPKLTELGLEVDRALARSPKSPNLLNKVKSPKPEKPENLIFCKKPEKPVWHENMRRSRLQKNVEKLPNQKKIKIKIFSTPSKNIIEL